MVTHRARGRRQGELTACTRHPGPAIALQAQIAQSRDLQRSASVRQVPDSLAPLEAGLGFRDDG